MNAQVVDVVYGVPDMGLNFHVWRMKLKKVKESFKKFMNDQIKSIKHLLGDEAIEESDDKEIVNVLKSESQL